MNSLVESEYVHTNLKNSYERLLRKLNTTLSPDVCAALENQSKQLGLSNNEGPIPDGNSEPIKIVTALEEIRQYLKYENLRDDNNDRLRLSDCSFNNIAKHYYTSKSVYVLD